MTAHPFLDPVNGEMVFFRYAVARPPFLTLFVADRDGRIVAERAIDTGVPYMIHDFAVTERRIVFVLAPVVFDLAARQQGKPMLAWQPERATRIAVLDRADLHGPIRWCETEPLFLYHFLNAHDDGDAVAIDYVRHDRFALLEGTQAPRLARMVVAGGRVEHTALPSPAVEFPRIDDRRRGLKHRYGYAAVLERGRRGAIARFDAATGAVLLRDFGPGKEVGEPVFAPRAGSADETAGWVMAFVYDHATDRSDFVLLDARDFGGAAAAEIHLPRRVPHGLHGNWMAA